MGRHGAVLVCFLLPLSLGLLIILLVCNNCLFFLGSFTFKKFLHSLTYNGRYFDSCYSRYV